MAGTLVQNPTVVTFSGAASVNKTFASSCTTGSLLVAMATQEQLNGTFTISDPTNGNWTDDKTQSTAAGSNQNTGTIRSFANNAATTALTITCEVGANTYGTLSIFELSGMATASPVDATSSAAGVATSATTTLTTATANASIFVVCAGYANQSPPDSGFTTHFGATGLYQAYHAGEYKVDAGAAGANVITINGWSASGDWQITAVAYKPAGGGGGGGATLAGRRSLLGAGM